MIQCEYIWKKISVTANCILIFYYWPKFSCRPKNSRKLENFMFYMLEIFSSFRILTKNNFIGQFSACFSRIIPFLCVFSEIMAFSDKILQFSVISVNFRPLIIKLYYFRVISARFNFFGH